MSAPKIVFERKAGPFLTFAVRETILSDGSAVHDVLAINATAGTSMELAHPAGVNEALNIARDLAAVVGRYE